MSTPKKHPYFRERECVSVCACMNVCVFAFERGFAMFGPTTMRACVCWGDVCVCKTERESERVLWDVSVFEQCVVVQPKALAQDFFSVWKWDYAFL